MYIISSHQEIASRYMCMDVKYPEMGHCIAQQRISFVQVYIQICSVIYIWVMDNLSTPKDIDYNYRHIWRWPVDTDT